MPYYKIKYGLSGGFGGCENGDEQILKCKNEDEANRQGWVLACEYYEQYDGLYGLRSVEQIMEEEEVDNDEALKIWEQEREDWLDYKVEEIKSEGGETSASPTSNEGI